MDKNKYYLVAAVVAVVVIAAGMALYSKTSQAPKLAPEGQTNIVDQGPNVNPAATGNIDAATAAIKDDSLVDEPTIDQTDPTLEENQAFNDFGQSFDGNQL